MSADSVQFAIEAWLSGDLRRAESLLLAAAENGSGHAAHELGTLYATGGPGFNRDPQKSSYWFERSLAAGFEATIATDPTWFRKFNS